MKKVLVVLLVGLMLAGCAAEPTFETIADGDISAVIAQQRSVEVSVGERDVILQSDSGTLYLCDGYSVAVQVLSGGNLDATLQTVTGFERDVLTLMQTASGELGCYECAWSAVTEEGEVVCRAVILDDGLYHYCVSVLVDAEDAKQLQDVAAQILDSVRLN